MSYLNDARFLKALRAVLGIEGGYSNDPRDSGGATSFGISLKFAQMLARYKAKRWLKTLDIDSTGLITPSDMKGLKKDVAIQIYYEEFWLQFRCPEVAWPASLMFFSYVVNMPPQAATRILQRAINYAGANVVIDGALGGMTLAASRRVDVTLLCRRLDAAASEHYADLGDAQPHYEQGWQFRSADALWWASHFHYAEKLQPTF